MNWQRVRTSLHTLIPERTKLEKAKERVPEMAVASERAPRTCNPNARYGMEYTERWLIRRRAMTMVKQRYFVLVS